MKDFLERDAATFVHARKTDRLDWETTLAEGEAYSTFLVPAEADPDPVRRFLKAYRAACQVIEAIVEVPVSVKLHPNTSSASEHNEILISTQVLEDTRLSFPHRMDVILGEAAHEAAHVLYTDFSQVNYDTRSAEGKLKHTIANIIEDERIETALGEDHPGYSRFIEKIKDYYFNRLFTDRLPRYETMNQSERLFLCFFRTVRYPTQLRAVELEEFGAALDQIKRVLTPYPTTNPAVHQATGKVYEILQQYHQPAQEQPEQPEQSGAGGDQDQRGKEGAQACDQEPCPSLEEALQEVTQQISEQISSSLDQGKEVEVAQALPTGEIMEEILAGSVTLGTQKDVFFIKPKGNAHQYTRDLAKVQRNARQLSNKLQLSYQDRIVRKTHLRSGDLDTQRIAEAGIGVVNVYAQQFSVKSKPVSVALLVDESGSMYCNERIERARECAVLFQEALKQLPGVQLYIYGHSADEKAGGTTELYVYQEPGYHPKTALGGVRARANNRDGVAIEQVGQRVRQSSADACVLFVISDGEPAADEYGGWAAIQQTRRAVAQLEKDNFTVIQIAIEESVPSQEMFNNFVKLTTMDRLVKDVSTLVRKVLLKLR